MGYGPAQGGAAALTSATIAEAGGFVTGGNSFGATATLGTNDANDLVLETGGTGRITLESDSPTFPFEDAAAAADAAGELQRNGANLSWHDGTSARVVTLLDASQALTNKTYEGLTITTSTGTLTIANGKTLTASSTIRFIGVADGDAFTFPSGSDTVVTLGATQTLTAKTLTSPDINAGTADSLTSLSIRSTGAAFDLTLATATVLTAGRTLRIDPGDSARTITLSGNPTLDDWFDQAVKAASSPTFANLTITSFAANWTNAGRTVADLGTVTTVDINGGTVDGVTIGGASAAAGTFTTLTASGIVDVDAAIRFDTGAAIVAGTYSIGRDADATNQLHFEVPTGAGYEWSINDVRAMSLLTAGNLIIGTATTANGAGNMLYSRVDQNNYTGFEAHNATSGTASQVIIGMRSSIATLSIGATSAAFTPGSGKLANDCFLQANIGALSFIMASTSQICRWAINNGGTTIEVMRLDASTEALWLGATANLNGGRFEITKNQNAGSYMYVINTTDGTAAHAGYQTQIGSAGNRVFGGILNYSVSYTTSGNTIAGEVQLYGSTACTGIAIRAYTAAPIRFITNDVVEVRLLSGGGLMINATSKVGSEELRVGGASQFDGELTLADAVNIVVNTTTGTKIGTATTQKLSVYNATPIVQGVAVADASGGATVDAEARTAINTLLARIRAFGIIAT